MSHNPLRKETNCLNCGTQVHGRFCHVCGQENTETRESFWSLTKHFVYDILHFDGKFFYTLKYLFTKPGMTGRRYAEGKRVSFLHPIRMYLFTSAIFFLVFFSVNAIKVSSDALRGELTNKSRVALAGKYSQRIAENVEDSFLKARIPALLDTSKRFNIDSAGWQKNNFRIFSFDSDEYNSVAAYDSAQAALPADKRNGWFKNKFIRQGLKTNAKYGTGAEGAQTFSEQFLHKLPYLLFISLPFFALILKLLYIRRKNFYYSDHAVFTLYHYIFSFILLLVQFGLSALQDALHWGFITILQVLVGLAWPVYLFIELKNFYRQGWFKTFVKFLILNFLGFLVILLLFVVFFLFSIFQS